MSPAVDHAELIAKAVTTLSHGAHVPRRSTYPDDKLQDMIALASTATVVDITPIYSSWIESGDKIDMYESTVMRPPWLDAVLCYAHSSGSGTVMMSYVCYLDAEQVGPELRWESDSGTHAFDWSDVAWLATFLIFAVNGQRAEGPMHSWRIAVDGDGRPLDIRWQQLRHDIPRDTWDVAFGAITRALTFLNCRNVTIVEPHRPRASRRRVERALPGRAVTEIQVFPRGVSVRGSMRQPGQGGTPLHSVIGHVAHYGCHGRGLLFGKITGEFWIPQHARGSIEHGERDHRYNLHTDNQGAPT